MAAHAATWYAKASSVNINAAGTWVPTQTGSCTGSGTALVFGNQANGDVFNANGCTALAVNVDPGGVSVQVTLTTDATNGGGFTYATAANITIHANITATKTPALVITGSTGGGAILGNITGGSSTSAYGVEDEHTAIGLTLAGNITGGSGPTAYGYDCFSATGTLAITGNATAGSFSTAHGLDIVGGSIEVALAGNCVGSNGFSAAGCSNASLGAALIVTGNLLFGLSGSVAIGVTYTPGPSNYVLFPKDSSYTVGVVNTHAVQLFARNGSSYPIQ